LLTKNLFLNQATGKNLIVSFGCGSAALCSSVSQLK
jgi:hypothetical protein